ncbi:MAG: ribosomal protein S18-alanine N-acetyltransferase [Bacilli bacterium]|jgi:ribosomal-protein-alanine N-acetyltransferase|nr:ribosomal protein S18-alanine N-acetyltransferase [Bacilli bacterium]
MKLVKASASDIDDVIDIHNRHFLKCNYDDYYKELNSEYSTFLVLKNQNTIIGYLVVYILFQTMEIVSICIDDSFQHQGYGKFLLEYSEFLAYKHNCEEILLEVEEKNIHALDVYVSFGFGKIHIRKNYYGTNRNAIIMKKLVE